MKGHRRPARKTGRGMTERLDDREYQSNSEIERQSIKDLKKEYSLSVIGDNNQTSIMVRTSDVKGVERIMNKYPKNSYFIIPDADSREVEVHLIKNRPTPLEEKKEISGYIISAVNRYNKNHPDYQQPDNFESMQEWLSYNHYNYKNVSDYSSFSKYMHDKMQDEGFSKIQIAFVEKTIQSHEKLSDIKY